MLEEESLRLKRQHLPAGHPGIVESIEATSAACYEESGRRPEAETLRRQLTELNSNAEKQNPGVAQPKAPPANP